MAFCHVHWTRAVCILDETGEKLLVRCCNVIDIRLVWHSGKFGKYEACPSGFTMSELHYSYGIAILVLLMSLRFYLRHFAWSMLYRSNVLIFHVRRFFWITRIERNLKYKKLIMKITRQFCILVINDRVFFVVSSCHYWLPLY
jgi:hypothetical protein